jgi:hypothetical protein
VRTRCEALRIGGKFPGQAVGVAAKRGHGVRLNITRWRLASSDKYDVADHGPAKRRVPIEKMGFAYRRVRFFVRSPIHVSPLPCALNRATAIQPRRGAALTRVTGIGSDRVSIARYTDRRGECRNSATSSAAMSRCGFPAATHSSTTARHWSHGYSGAATCVLDAAPAYPVEQRAATSNHPKRSDVLIRAAASGSERFSILRWSERSDIRKNDDVSVVLSMRVGLPATIHALTIDSQSTGSPAQTSHWPSRPLHVDGEAAGLADMTNLRAAASSSNATSCWFVDSHESTVPIDATCDHVVRAGR